MYSNNGNVLLNCVEKDKNAIAQTIIIFNNKIKLLIFLKLKLYY